MCDNDTSFELFEFNELNCVNKLAEQGFFVVIMKTSLCLSVCLVMIWICCGGQLVYILASQFLQAVTMTVAQNLYNQIKSIFRLRYQSLDQHSLTHDKAIVVVKLHPDYCPTGALTT